MAGHILSNRPEPTRRYHPREQKEEMGIDTSEPTVEELGKAIKSLKTNKAAGADQITAELIKSAGHIAHTRLHSLVVRIWREERIPDDWKRSELKVLYKKGDTTECKNYRGISLLSVAGKVFAWIILKRMQTTVDRVLRENQAGFRRNRGCIDQIFTLRILIEKCLEFQLPGVATFVDFKAAFNSVHRPALWRIMGEYGIPKKIINIVKSTYSGSMARVKVGREQTDWFSIETGVRQGCLWSPMLFGLVIDWVLRKSSRGRGMRMKRRVRTLRGIEEGWTLSDLDFADDVTQVEPNEGGAGTALRQLRRVGEEVGLVVSSEKN